MIKKSFFIFILFVMPVFASGKDVIQVGCFIVNLKGETVRNFPGHFCEFRPNGDRIEITLEKISYIDKNDSVLWTRPGFHHHQVKIDSDQKSIVTLGEIHHKVLGCDTRYDTLVIYDLKTGKKKKTVDFYSLYKDEKLFQDIEVTYLAKGNFRKTQENFECETSHVNSMFQIQENSIAKIDKAFTSGNWLVNFSKQGLLLIFDKNFDKLVWHKNYNFLQEFIHDVQFTKDGKIFFYINSYIKSAGKKRRTAIGEVDPLLESKTALKIIELKNNGKLFNQTITGGLQFLQDDKKMVSIYTDADGYQLGFYDKNWNQYRKITPFPSKKNKEGLLFQEARVINLNSFFKNYKGQL